MMAGDGPATGASASAVISAVVSAVVPTLGVSPHLERCLAALRADGGARMRIVVVAQGDAPRTAPEHLADFVDRWIHLPTNQGFTGGTNAGIAAAPATPYVATVNDDAVVQPGWTESLLAALDADPEVVAVQGVNLAGLAAPGEAPENRWLDGWGLAWNRWWQAVQLGHGCPAVEAPTEPTGVFGVSATAAMYRRRALETTSRRAGEPFDPRLGSWYEDADLAVRLHRAGGRCLTVPSARAEHVGGATAAGQPAAYRALLQRNRWLVVAGLRGRRFPWALPALLARDLIDGLRSPRRLPAIVGGWWAALLRLPGWLHAGPALDPRRPGDPAAPR